MFSPACPIHGRLECRAGEAVRVGHSAIAALGIVTFALTATTALWTYRRIRRTAVSPVFDAIQHNDAPRRQRWRGGSCGE